MYFPFVIVYLETLNYLRCFFPQKNSAMKNMRLSFIQSIFMLFDPSISTNSMQNEFFILKAYWSYLFFEGIKRIFYLRRNRYLKHFSFAPIWGFERTIFLTKESLCLIKIYWVDHNFIFFYCLNCQSLVHELQEKSVSIFFALHSY